MNGRFSALAVATLAVVTALPLHAQLLPPENPAASLVVDLAARRFDKVHAGFDERMAAALPASELATVWDGLIAQFGAFQAIGAVREQQAGEARLVIIPCRFANGSLDAKVALDRQGRVAGLFFAPSEAAADEWKAAGYVLAAAFSEREVTVGGGAWKLPGTLTLPKAPGKHPAIVLVHGSGPNDRDETIGPNKPFKDLAWGLASRGVVVLRFDKRTRVYGKEIKAAMSGGHGFTVNDETVEDAKLAAILLTAQPEVDDRRIFVLGHSLGGMLAPRIAAGSPGIAGLVILAGNTRPLEDLVLAQIRYIAGLDGVISEAEKTQIAAAEKTVRDAQDPALKPGTMVDFMGIPIPASYILDLRGYRPAQAAAALKIPMLIARGERDYQVTSDDFEGWKAALAARPDVAFKLYPALNHLFISGTGPSTPADTLRAGHVGEEVVRDIATWIVTKPAAVTGGAK